MLTIEYTNAVLDTQIARNVGVDGFHYCDKLLVPRNSFGWNSSYKAVHNEIASNGPQKNFGKSKQIQLQD